MIRTFFTFLLTLACFAALMMPLPALSRAERMDGHRPDAPAIPSPRPSIASDEISTARFRLVHTARAKGAAESLSKRIEKARDAFQQALGRDWPGITEIRIGVGREEFDQLALPGGKPPGWAAAIAYPGHNIIVLDAVSLSKPEGEVTLRHELSHVALGQLAAEAWPHWFQEGVAMYLTGDGFSISQYTALFRAVTQERLFDFEDLSTAWPQHAADVEIAYAQSAVFVAHLVQRYGPGRLGELIDHVRDGAGFEVAFARAFKTSLGVEQDAWAKDLPNRYSWVPIITGGTVVWVLASLLTVLGWLRRRRVLARRKAEMAAEEAAEDAALRLAEANAGFSEPDGTSTSDPAWGEWPPWPEEGDEDEDSPNRPRRVLH